MREIEHKDYFGNIINVGDEVLCARYSELEKEIIGKITPTGIFFKTTKRIRTSKPGVFPPVYDTVPHLLRKDARYFAQNMIVLNNIKNND